MSLWLDWSDTTTFLLEAEVLRIGIASNVRHSCGYFGPAATHAHGA